MMSLFRATVSGVALLTVATAAQAVVSPVTPQQLTSTSYSQNFNTLAATGGQVARALPTGWQISEANTGTSYSNSNANGYYYGGSTSGQSGAIGAVSYGTNSADRALGGRAHADVPTIRLGAIFQNDLGSTIDSLTLGYNGEQWANGFSRATLTFEYSLDATSLENGTWTSFSDLDFLAPNNEAHGTSTTDRVTAYSVNGNSAAFSQQLNGVIGGLSIADGASFGLRWSLNYISAPHVIGDTVYNVSTNDGLAIDNFSLTASVAAVPEPASWAMMIGGFGLVGGAMRRRSAKLAIA